MKPVILTTMCTIINDKGEILVENRIKKDWPGLTFPGGHVEDNENTVNACIREMKEETGLEVNDLINKGYIEWNDFGDGVRHFAVLFLAKEYKGKIKSSKEGEVFFISLKDIHQYPFSNDFDKILKLILN